MRNIYGRCSEGQIDWRHPYGAVRVSLQLGLRKETQFETCFIARSQFVNAKISLEDARPETASADSDWSLAPLVTLNASHSEMTREICVQSKGHPVVLYMEALPERQATNIGSVELYYDNQRVFPKARNDDMEGE